MTLRDELQPIFWRVFDPDSSTQGNVQAALDAAMPIIDRWLAAHDAEVRAAALAEQGETEWEYGNEMLMNNHTQIYPASSEFMAKAQAWLWPMYRRRKAGPWEAVPAAENNEREEKP